ncbi:hypothetical protein A2U01_0047078, partial [Trifolium medium]|nr:hypothetical protein [Trifolium medium]
MSSMMVSAAQSNFKLDKSVVIDAELGRKDHGSIPATTTERELKSLDVRTDPRIRLSGPVGRILR